MGVGEGGATAVVHATRILRLVGDGARQHRQRTGAAIQIFHDLDPVETADDHFPLGGGIPAGLAAAGVDQFAVDVPVDVRPRMSLEEDREYGGITARDGLILETEGEPRRLVYRRLGLDTADARWRTVSRRNLLLRGQRIDGDRWLQWKDHLHSGRERLTSKSRRETRLQLLSSCELRC